ncbi:MAG: MotA/TolQ/ExbB proton channel family protein [Myxococcaceae bacterium]|nr:MotA/TolQ/ExbB proton channel family protein [Myxococcaceae bacterium]
MSFDIVKIVGHMGVFDKGILLVIVAMALASLIVFLERLIAFSRSRSQNRKFASVAAGLLSRDQHQELVTRSDAAKSSHLAQLIGSGMKTYLSQRARPEGKVSPVELTRRELVRKSEAVAADVRRGMSVLASVGSVAPFVGLLGTVMGIINSFQGMAREGSGGLGAVSSGISEALLVTAAGLVVAIPAVLAFNMLTTQSEKILLALDQARGEFLDYLENTHGDARAHRGHGAEMPASAVATGRETHDVRRV